MNDPLVKQKSLCSSECFVVFKFSCFFFLFHSYAGLSLRYSLTLGSSHSAGQQMKRKLMAILRLKCHALFFDLKVRNKNIFKTFQNAVTIKH